MYMYIYIRCVQRDVCVSVTIAFNLVVYFRISSFDIFVSKQAIV